MFRYAGIAMLALLCGCQHQTSSGVLDQERLLHAFDNAMFEIPSHPLKNDPDYQPRIVRWTAPIRVRVLSGKDGHRSPETEINRAITQLAELTGLDIRQVESDREEANFLIRYESAREFRLSDGRRASCFTRTWVTQAGLFSRAEIHLPLSDRHAASQCLYHELMHGIGFRGHVAKVSSVLARHVSRTRFTKWDKQLLRLLYRPELQPGMARAETRTMLLALLNKPAQLAQTDPSTDTEKQ